MSKQAEHLDRAIQLMGGLRAAQQALGLNTYQALQQWRVARVPAERCIEIERATFGAVRCEDLRPDVDWAYLRATDCHAANADGCQCGNDDADIVRPDQLAA